MRRFATLVLSALLAGPAPAADNILVLVGDDVGIERVEVFGVWDDASQSATPPITPRLDEMAAQGIRFANAWSNPVCSPTRAMAMTGRHGLRTGIGGITTPGSIGLDVDAPGDELTLPRMLATLSSPTYRSHALGKWHLGGGEGQQNPDQDHAVRAGFESYAGVLFNIPAADGYTYGGVEGEQGPEDAPGWPKTSATQSGASTVTETEYATRWLADEVIAKIDALAEPWFLWVGFNAAHSPFHVPPCNAGQGNCPQGSAQPLGVAYDFETTLSSPPTNPQMHRAMTEVLDHEIGRILDHIRAKDGGDFQDRTTVLYFSDNGTPVAAVDSGFTASHAKGSLYEPGVNVPLIAWSPGRIPAQNQNGVVTEVVNVTDVFDTVRELAGISQKPAEAVDSESFLSCFADLGCPGRAREHVYAEKFEPLGIDQPRIASPEGFGELHAIRDEAGHKLVQWTGLDAQLFDLSQAHPLEAKAQNLLCDGVSAQEQTWIDALKVGLAGVLDVAPGCTGTNDLDRDGVCDPADPCILATDFAIADIDPGEPGYDNNTDSDPTPDDLGDACDLDFDGNMVVGGFDFNTIRNAFGKSLGQTGYEARIDVNKDEAIGGPEFNELRNRFGRQPGPGKGTILTENGDLCP